MPEDLLGLESLDPAQLEDDNEEEVDDETSDSDDSDSDDADDSEDSDEDDSSDEESDDEDETTDSDETETETDEDEEDDSELEAQPLTVQNITKQFPKIAKLFPDLIPAIQVADKFQQIFDTPEEAESAKETIQGVEKFNEDLSNGNIGSILTFMYRSDEKGTNLALQNFLPTIFKADKDTYAALTQPVLTLALGNIAHAANLHGNKNLALAVKYVTKAIFGSEEIPPSKMEIRTLGNEKKEEKVDPKTEKLENHFRSTVSQSTFSKVDRFLEKEILPKLPGKGDIKQMRLEKLKSQVMAAVDADQVYIAMINKFYQQAAKEDFLPGQELINRITTTYLQRFQALLQPSLRKILKEAGVKDKDKSESTEKSDKKKKFISNKTKAEVDKSRKNKEAKDKPPRRATVAGDSAWLMERMGAN